MASNAPPRLPRPKEIAAEQERAWEDYFGDVPETYRWCRIAMGAELHPWNLIAIMYGGGEAPGYLNLTTRQVYSIAFHPAYDPFPGNYGYAALPAPEHLA